MTLYQKTILIIVSTFIALLFILATTSNLILLESYSSLEKSEVISDTQNISNQIDDKLKHLDNSAHEIIWYAQKNGLQQTMDLLTESYMRGHMLSIAALYDADGYLVNIKGFDCKKNVPISLLVKSQNSLTSLVSRSLLGKNITEQGVVNLGGAPLMLVLKHISANKVNRGGVILVGYFIDNVEMEKIFKASVDSITLFDLNSNLDTEIRDAIATINEGEAIHVAAIDSEFIAGYFVLRDFYNQSSFIVKSVEKRTLYEQGKVTIAYVFTALFIAGAVFCFVMLAFVRGTILNRLKFLTTKVSRITELHDISERLPLSEHQDELRKLAFSINSMLDSLGQAERGMRENEELYRTLFERAPDAIIIIGMEGDEAGRIISANQAAAHQHGYTVDELLGLRIYDLNTPETNKIAGDIFARIANGDWVIAEIWHQKKDGTQFPIEISAGIIKIAGKSYALGFDRDITERKLTDEMNKMHLQQINLLNDELKRKAADLATVNSEMETFNYSVSHDMRGPLTRLSGYCQLLLDADSEISQTSREYITRIYESGVWLNDMIDALIGLAGLTRAEIVTGEVNLSIIAETALKELALANSNRSVSIYVEPDIVASGDFRLLKIAMVNMLENAWKYSSLNDNAVIEFGVIRSGTDMVYFIRDNGVGFEMKDSDKLFSVFTRLHNSTQFKGTGIGLATVQRIISKHGGRIWVEAKPGAGATFYFTLPAGFISSKR